MVKTVSHAVGKLPSAALHAEVPLPSPPPWLPQARTINAPKKCGSQAFSRAASSLTPFVLSQLVVGLSYHSVAVPVAGSRISIPARSRPTLSPGHTVHEKPAVVSGTCNLLQCAPRIEVGTPDQQRWPPLFPLLALFKALQSLALPVELDCSSKQPER